MQPDQNETKVSALFSQENPSLYFHKSPAKGKQLPDLSGKHGLIETAYSR